MSLRDVCMDAIEILAECWSDAWAAGWRGTYGFFNSDEEVKYWRNADRTAGVRLENVERGGRKWRAVDGLHVNRFVVVRNSKTSPGPTREDVDTAREIRKEEYKAPINNHKLNPEHIAEWEVS